MLPFGDYDPRISPDGSKVVFERMVDDSSQHGNYDLFIINIDGSGETRITETGWTQGIASWSSDGEALAYLVSAKGSAGAYDIFTINRDGSEMIDQTSEILPDTFLAHSVLYSADDTIYFVGQWWDWSQLETTLTCTASKATAQVEDSVTVSGTIGPRLDEANIKLTIRKPDGSEDTTEVPVADGKYSYNLDVDSVGEWSVIAIWEGDAGHMDAQSGSADVSVVEAPEPDDGGGDGVPGFPVSSLVFGALIVLAINRKRLNHWA